MIKENLDDRWITTEEVADYLGGKSSTIREWIKKDVGIPAHKIGRCWRFKKTELDDWVNSGKSANCVGKELTNG